MECRYPRRNGCIYSNKDKNFKANHNDICASSCAMTVVSIVTKIRILKQITTSAPPYISPLGCIYSNKDKNFKANHNWCRFEKRCRFVVSIVTKIRILKQITTINRLGNQTNSCIYSNKDKNFKANHNALYSFRRRYDVVSIVTKIRILKQITTCLTMRV